MQSSCRPEPSHSRATRIGCLLCLAAGLLALPARAIDSGSANNLLCQNNSDGATLPPPTRKQPQAGASASADDGSGERKKRRKNGDDSSTASQDSHAGDSKRGDSGKVADVDANKKNSEGFANKPPEGHRPGPGHRGGMFAEMDFSVLNLSDDQKEKIGQMRSENRPKVRDLRRRFEESNKQKLDLMFDGTTTEAQIRKKNDEIRQLAEQLDDFRLNDFLAIRAILTPEQRAKLKDVRTAMEERRREAAAQQTAGGAKRIGPDGGAKIDGKRGGPDGGPAAKTDSGKRPIDTAGKPDSLSNR